jgi:hypothetical protein
MERSNKLTYGFIVAEVVLLFGVAIEEEIIKIGKEIDV